MNNKRSLILIIVGFIVILVSNAVSVFAKPSILTTFISNISYLGVAMLAIGLFTSLRKK